MTKEQLYKLIAQGEGQRLEFKKSVAELDRVIQTLTAFANTNSDGGYVLIGVGDKGKVKGVIIGKETIKQIADKISAHTDPVLYPKIEVVKESGDKGIIVITIDGSPNKPHLAFGRSYKRVGSTTTQMTRDEYERLLLAKHESKFQFDSQVCDGATLDDIDEERVGWFLRIARAKRGLTLNDGTPVGELLTHLQLVSEAGLTNAAVMLFGKSPDRFFLQSEIKCIALPAMEFIKPYTTYHAHGGNLFEQVDKASAFILENWTVVSSQLFPGWTLCKLLKLKRFLYALIAELLKT
ncbi:MAG: putative DNA binding domain-containing protein [bacterium]|nr:putative DNA binding domain-containing protein [bacterium]